MSFSSPRYRWGEPGQAHPACQRPAGQQHHQQPGASGLSHHQRGTTDAEGHAYLLLVCLLWCLCQLLCKAVWSQHCLYQLLCKEVWSQHCFYGLLCKAVWSQHCLYQLLCQEVWSQHWLYQLLFKAMWSQHCLYQLPCKAVWFQHCLCLSLSFSVHRRERMLGRPCLRRRSELRAPTSSPGGHPLWRTWWRYGFKGGGGWVLGAEGYGQVLSWWVNNYSALLL